MGLATAILCLQAISKVECAEMGWLWNMERMMSIGTWLYVWITSAIMDCKHAPPQV